MITLGITGRSGCGKSTVTAVFTSHGIHCADGDQISREVLLPGSPCLEQLAARFGNDILFKDGTLNRRLLADRAFKTQEDTAALTAITHPEILRRFLQAKHDAEQGGVALFLLDGATIVDTPFEKECDRLLVITAPYETSVQRICARDGISAEMARRRLDAQTAEEYLISRADYVLTNDSTQQALREKAEQLVLHLQEEANGQT